MQVYVQVIGFACKTYGGLRTRNHSLIQMTVLYLGTLVTGSGSATYMWLTLTNIKNQARTIRPHNGISGIYQVSSTFRCNGQGSYAQHLRIYQFFVKIKFKKKITVVHGNLGRSGMINN